MEKHHSREVQILGSSYSNDVQGMQNCLFNEGQTIQKTSCNTEQTENMYSSDTGRAKRANNFKNKRTVRIYVRLVLFVYIRSAPPLSPTHPGRPCRRYFLVKEEAEEEVAVDEDSVAAACSKRSVQYVGTKLSS